MLASEAGGTAWALQSVPLGAGSGCVSTCSLSHYLRMIHGFSTQTKCVSHQEKPLGRIPSVRIHRGLCEA